jgi:hypothetical protein
MSGFLPSVGAPLIGYGARRWHGCHGLGTRLGNNGTRQLRHSPAQPPELLQGSALQFDGTA